MIFPSSFTSLITRFTRSSKSPRYFDPATIAGRSRERIRLDATGPTISPATIFCASASAMLVLPTPGSPTRHGLFFVRLLKICTIRLISSARPMIGSSLPILAASFRSVLKSFKMPSFFWPLFFLSGPISALWFSGFSPIEPKSSA